MPLMTTTSIPLPDISTLFNRCCCCCLKPIISSNYNFSSSNNPAIQRKLRVSRVLVPGTSSRRRRRRRRRSEVHNRNGSSSWWRKLFSDEEGGDWGSGTVGNGAMWEEEGIGDEENGVVSEDEKFEAWKRRAEAIIELREAQEGARNQQSRNWEDWVVLHEETNGGVGYGWGGGGGRGGGGDGVEREEGDSGGGGEDVMVPVRGFVESVRDLVLGREDDDDDILYEDRVFRYASLRSAKFLAILIVIPWALDLLVHDYILMPFLDRYVKTVPLAAEILDVRRSQKLEIVQELKLEKARFRLEAGIGKAPPLSEDEIFLELRQKAIHMCDDRRLENRRAFAYIWSDLLFGISLFILLYFNQSELALLKFTGYKIINNISDAGKAFLIILLADIFLGYHSEVGWQALCEILLERYGLEVDQSAITIFVCFFPVAADACVKLWLFRLLPGVAPRVAKILQEMKRH